LVDVSDHLVAVVDGDRRHVQRTVEFLLVVAHHDDHVRVGGLNLVGGDPYGGFCGLDQSFLWRPFKSSVNHRTFIRNLYHIGASTHPGAGLGGGSGFMLAQALR
jgi:phytoene dehydrogenase-like protein